MTDSESHSLSEKGSRNSATFSIHSLEDVPVRKSAVQIIRERSTDMFHHPPGSPRKQRATMQITKLVLKDPPTSPSRRKITPVVIKSIQTYTSSALTNCGQENRKMSGGESRPEEEFKIIPLLNAGQLMEQFEAQKNERNAASSDFQSYLVESFNKENEERAAIQISKISTPSDESAANLVSAPQANQGKSDSSSSATKTVTSSATSSSHAATAPSGTGKSSSTTTTSSASSALPPPPPPVTEKMPSKPPSVRRTSRPRTQPEPAVPEARKEKSYDPQRAREFIKEQQAKRKQEKRTSGPPACEKELIRKRLDDLRKNTQVLVNKNVQKARKRSLSATPAAASGSSQKSGTPLRALDSGGRGIPAQRPLRKSVSTSSLKAVGLPPAASSVKSSSAASSRRRSSLLKADLSEKMGIMRKPEEVPLGDVLVSPLRMVTPPSPPKFEQRVDELGKRLMETQEEGERSRSFLELEKELKLEVPEVTLVPDSIIKNEVCQEPQPQQPSKPIPSWLKHTLIQPDPYPFIVAVRKKLEAACNRPDELPVTGKSRASKSSKRCDEYLKTLKSVPYIRKSSKAGGRDETPPNISSISHQSSVPNTTSDISSIRSDFVLSLPPLSSTKIDTNATSNSVQQPQVVSPLSVERISNLKITATDSSLEKVNFTRGDDMPNADLIPDRVSFSARHVVDLDQTQLSVNTSEKQRNFLHNSSQAENTTHEYQRMLEAFNRSLSQVIEVNQQLYSTLSVKIRDEMTQTTPVPAASAVSTTANGSSSNYTDDFERSGAATAVQKSDSTSSADSTPQKSSFTTTTAPTTSSSSSGDSPDSKTNSSESEQLLLDSRSFASLSDSHNTNPPMPEEYLPSFEESLRRQEVVAAVADKSDEPASATTEKGVYSSSSIATQISDEVREEVRAVNSVESISMKFSVGSDVANEEVSPKVEMLKKPATSSSSSSEMEALNARVADSEREEDHRMNDTTMGSDILAMFNRTDLEISVMSTTVSEANLSYSSIGLYDQLIQNEKSKTDQLASRARLKEKALLDRTKGQLAWLELQKQRYRERGMLEQISTTKKKQRAILVRLERERAELNRFKKAASEVPLRSVGSRSPHRSIEKLNSFSSASNSISLRKSAAGSGRSEIGSPQLQRKLTATTTMTTMLAAVRGVELEPSGSLENILQRREQELQKRREHVQALLEWHRKLDQEEQQIREIEQNLLRYNRDKVEVGSKGNDTSVAALGRIRSIEASLQTLQQIPDDRSEQQQQQRRDSTDEEVQASGGKLNRLWYRLTGVKEARYDTARSYTLTKASLERLYEEAKAKVLEGFRGGTTLLDQSLSGINSTQGSVGNVSVIERKEEGEVEVVSSDANSLKTTSEVLVAEKELESSQQEASSRNGEVIEEEVEEELPDVDEIISRVSDITDNMKDLLSSTTKLDDMLQSQQDKPASESVEFHTTIDEGEEERDSTGQNNYSTSFDASTIEELPRQGIELAVPTNDSQLMIEDTSLPAGILDDSIAESIPEASDKITPASEASLEEASSMASSATTPTTAEETETEYNEVASPAPPVVASELEKRLVQLNDKLGELSDSFERVPLMRSPDRQIASDSSEPSSSSTVEEDLLGNTLNQKPESPPEAPKIEIKIRTKTVNDTFPNLAAPPPASPPSSPTSAPPVFSPTATSTNRMPDIINEAEVLRRQELQIEQEIKQLEQQVVFLREIPNKPPPPYIPPANGSPLALIFPTEQRIDELIEDRTRHLFHSSDDTPALSSDHVTNIYEKLVLDMCGELFTDLRAPTPDVSFRTVRHDKRPLAFFNPPNALNCLQHHMKRKVKKILNEETLAQQQQQNLHHCPMPYLGMAAPGIGGAKRKRDQVDEILAQEMCDEEPRWTNFDREEIEVKERIVEELTKMLVADALQDMEGAWREREQSSTASMEEA
ncbi:centrosome-associated protein 350-like [Culex pipiens pallens]|uniref:centrosome-associated protein 350-like n=1 Tax=Culex pipiens pallens TaxID=42434 RepID=UPI001952B33B|nr:centrosome-associated protein 350-like [Culex pipiens pallens]